MPCWCKSAITWCLWMLGSGVMPSRGCGLEVPFHFSISCVVCLPFCFFFGGMRWQPVVGGNHAKVDVAGLELVIVQSEDDVSGLSRRVGRGCNIGWFMEHILGTGHD
eukprot:scaffold13863_cov59-Attheya_sp.AAC.4